MKSNLILTKLVNSCAGQFERVCNELRILKLRSFGITVTAPCLLEANVIAESGFANKRRGIITLHDHVKLKYGTILNAWGGSIEINSNVFIGQYSVIYGHGGVTIGQYSLIGTHCRILSSNHTIPEPESRICSMPDILLPTTIGEDVWLGAGVTVLGGVDIGNGCVVGAGAVVNKSLPPYSVAVGVPAKVVRMRS